MIFRVVERPGKGIAKVSADGDIYLWTLGSVRPGAARLVKVCGDCGGPLGKKAYRPQGNKAYRYVRLCVKCVELPIPRPA